MNTLIDMNPWNWLDALFDVDNRVTRTMRARAAGRLATRPPQEACFPPVNVFLDDNAVLIDMELPGKTAKDVDLTLEAQAVVVADKPAPVTDEKGESVQPKSAWTRRLELPFRVNAEKANAKFTDGILRIELPRAETQGVHRIAIAG